MGCLGFTDFGFGDLLRNGHSELDGKSSEGTFSRSVQEGEFGDGFGELTLNDELKTTLRGSGGGWACVSYEWENGTGHAGKPPKQ